MSDLERRARQLMRDWHALRRDLEEIRRSRQLGVFYSKQMEGIEAKIAEARQLVKSLEGHLAAEEAVPERAHAIGEQYSDPPEVRKNTRSRIQLFKEEDACEDAFPSTWAE